MPKGNMQGLRPSLGVTSVQSFPFREFGVFQKKRTQRYADFLNFMITFISLYSVPPFYYFADKKSETVKLAERIRLLRVPFATGL